MTRLKLADIADDKPVRVTLELPARLHRNLVAYAVAINGGNTEGAPPIERCIPPMLDRFISTDRQFVRGKRSG
ncbi:DUF2274 domain-containing protein [Novosphingobium aquae]|uniref:DUF2274 domain-containing protein n=1 Tax=Novosphingobium aquae TaxID=3133435 RepID=A0ABU8SAY3_9SPHN